MTIRPLARTEAKLSRLTVPTLPRPSMSFRAQTLLIVAAAVVSVSVVLIGIQATSIHDRVLGERESGIQRVAASLQESANYASSSGGSAFLQADLRRRLPDIGRLIGAEVVFISDSRGEVVASSDPSLEPLLEREAAAAVLRTGRPVTHSNSTDALIYALPFRLAGGEAGVFASRVSMQPLLSAIADASTASIVPSIIVLLIATPLAGVVSNRILARTYEREQDLRVEARFGSLVRNSSDLILIVGSDGKVQYVSPSVERVLGYRQTDIHGQALTGFLHLDDLLAASAFLDEAWHSSSGPARVEWRVRHHDGSWRDFEMFCTNLASDASVGGLVLNGRDVSERKLLEQELAHQAFHDPLTKLANRALFQDRVEQALARNSRRQDMVAVLFLDLDDFKTVNDSLGHEAGDQLLVAIAERLVSSVRPSDTVARLGGDEFAIVLEQIDGASLERAAERITHALRMPLLIENQLIYVTASIGIAPTSAGLETTQQLLRGADVAMYAAKNRGKGLAQIFDPSLQQAVIGRLSLDAELRNAIERGEMRVLYQPIVRLDDHRIVGVEALIRWQHPTRGLIAPDMFLDLAEDSGVIHQIAQFVLDVACRDVRSWHAAHGVDQPLTLCVNLSASQIQHAEIVAMVSSALATSGFPPHSLTLEITETAIMHDTEATLARLFELKRLGVRLAIDDFGTGYSSLGYLRRFPIDVLKIDRSFVDNVALRTDAMALVRAIVDLGHNLGLQMVAEGVENADQARELKLLGCDMGQGYLFARPIDSAGLVDILARRPPTSRVMPQLALDAIG